MIGTSPTSHAPCHCISGNRLGVARGIGIAHAHDVGRHQHDDLARWCYRVGRVLEEGAEDRNLGEERNLVDGAADFLVDQAVDHGHRLAVAQVDAGAGGAHEEVGQVDGAGPWCRRRGTARGGPVSPPFRARSSWVEMFMPIRPFSSTYLTVLSIIGAPPAFWMAFATLPILSGVGSLS